MQYRYYSIAKVIAKNTVNSSRTNSVLQALAQFNFDEESEKERLKALDKQVS